MPPPALLSLLAAFQAGGGGSFSGGGGGGHGGGDGGGGGGLIALLRLLLWLMRLTIEYPMVGVPCWIVGLVLVAVGLKRGWFEHQERVIRRTRGQRSALASRLASSALRTSDPAFDEARFLARMRLAFERTQRGWCAQELELLRPFVSDGVFERFSLQIEEQRADGWRQGMERLALAAPTIVHHAAGSAFESVTVRFTFQARIDRRALADGAPLAGSLLARTHFAECWTFLRRRGTRSLAGEGLFEGKCPNCAAPLTLNRTTRCTHCAAYVKNGSFDWVLVEITQASEWRAEEEAALPGFLALQAHDQALSAAALEDRASVAFWRLAAAERLRVSTPLASLADAATRATLEPMLARGESCVERAVGSVRTLGWVVRPESEHALVEVLWDGRRQRAGAKLEQGRTLQRTLFVFRRARGATSGADTALTTAHCRTCGAHDPGALDPQCEYCGAARLVPEHDWRLAAILPSSSHEAAPWLQELRTSARDRPRQAAAASGPSRADLLRWCAALALADGELAPRERAALEALGAALGLEASEIAAACAHPVPVDALRAPAGDEGRRWFRELVRTALSDGQLMRDERRFLQHTATRLGLEPATFRQELGSARLILWRTARAARRARA